MFIFLSRSWWCWVDGGEDWEKKQENRKISGIEWKKSHTKRKIFHLTFNKCFFFLYSLVSTFVMFCFSLEWCIKILYSLIFKLNLIHLFKLSFFVFRPNTQIKYSHFLQFFALRNFRETLKMTFCCCFSPLTSKSSFKSHSICISAAWNKNSN